MRVSKPLISVRERNRLGTWSCIHEAAARIALKVGPSEATVLAISAEAGVSMRSFFNYFPNKEDAILGIGPVTLSPAAIIKFQSGEADALRRTVILLADVMGTLTPNPGLSAQQVKLIRKFPELRARIMEYIEDAKKLLVPIIIEQIKKDPLFAPGLQAAAPEEAARVLLMLAGITGRLALNEAPSNFSIDPESLNQTIALLKAAITEA